VIEIRILRGARQGQAQSFDQPVITIGRHASNDLRFDAQQDLDVSSHHAELRRQADGGWAIADKGSTNGTFVNGARVGADTKLSNGDTVTFGPAGPKIAVQFAGPRAATEVRVAAAVKKQTKTLRNALVGAVVVLGALGLGAYWVGHNQSAKQIADLKALLAQSDSINAQLVTQSSEIGDTAFTRTVQQRADSLSQLVAARDKATSEKKDAREVDSLHREIQRLSGSQQAVADMGLPQIRKNNDPAVALLRMRLGGSPFGATAFSVSSSGVLVTSRHNVVFDDGSPATDLEVQFTNTSTRHKAHVVLVSKDSAVDLAILQIDAPGPFPVVSGVSRDGAVVAGGTLASIGFPRPRELAMDGPLAKPQGVPGFVSRKADTLFITGIWAEPGSSGSPVFDGRGIVVGVISGGIPEPTGLVVFAVPSDKLATMLPAEARAIVR
jgi:S1-C subfamily serine protease